MNILTRKIRNKGYSLLEFCEVYSISLRSYRRYEKEDHPDHWILIEWIDKLEGKLSATAYDLQMVKKLIDINFKFYKHTPKEMQLKFDDWCEEYERK